MNQPSINVLSSFSMDTLLDEGGNVLNQQAGGPALFIERVLREVSLPYKLQTGESIDVGIRVTNNGEHGRVLRKPQKRTINYEPRDWTIVSTILDEWQLTEPLPERLCVDLQGYVRDGSNFGRKRTNTTINRLAGAIYCLKGTVEEVGYLSKSALERQKNKLLLITNGADGVTLYHRGESRVLAVEEVVVSSDTIGAGDTFFAYFIASIFQGNIPTDAVSYAIRQTSEFLKSKTAMP